MEINSSFKVPISSFSQIFAQPPPTTVPDYSAPVYQSQINPYAFQYSQGIHQAPITNLTSGHPTFYFKERKTHLNWDKIDSIDLDEVRNGANKHLLEACLGNVVFAKLSEEDCEHFHDPVLLKMFRLSQYGLEYMLNYQNYLFSQMQNLDLAYRQAGDTLKPMEMQARENQDEIQRLKEEIYLRQMRIDVYEKTLNSSIHKCKMCQKCFKSREYLREHMKRRHAVAPKPVNTSQRIVMRDISTSPLVAKNAENSLQKQPSKQEQPLKTSQEREKKILTEKGVGDDTIFINETHNNATIEKIKEMLDHIREGDNKQLSQIGELLQEKFQEVLKANDEIGQRVQELQNKVEGSLSYSKQDISGIHVDEEYEDKENRSINANRRREVNTSNKGHAASDENIIKTYESKRSPNLSNQDKSAKKANYEEYGGRSGIREKALSPAEAQEQVAYQTSEHYNREHINENENKSESRTAEKQKRTESDGKRAKVPEETPTKGLVAQLSKESAQLYHKDDAEGSAEKESKESESKEVRESKEMRSVNRMSPNSPEILEIEEYQDSGNELAKYAKAQVADIEKNKNKKTENEKDLGKKIEEAVQTEEEEPIYEDEDERERTMRIIEGTMGIRGDEDKMLEKDKRAYMRAKEAMEKKYTFEEVEPKEAEQAEEHIKDEVMSKFKKLFGEDYDTLAGKDVTNLEEILCSLRLLNQQQTQRFNQMKDDFQKTQRRSILSFGEDRKSARKSSLDEEPVISSERQDIEGKENQQTDSQKIRKAKESLAELEQLIKESQDSRSHISLYKE